MKPILLFFCLTISASAFAQVKIDAGFVFMNGQFEYGTQNAKWWALVPDAFAVKEISTGKVCKMVSHQITFLIKGESFLAADAVTFKQLSAKLLPNDKIFIDKIKLEAGCFAPPKSIAITIQ